MQWAKVLEQFLLQAQKGDLKTSTYPKEWADLRLRVSFGMGMPARVPWIAFVAPEMQVSRGFYPVYLYYKELNALILAYGISETEEYAQTWPPEVMNSTETMAAHFDAEVPRYGTSFVFKAYDVGVSGEVIKLRYSDNKNIATEKDVESDLNTILDYYKKVVSINVNQPGSEWGRGVFYMEKQLEDFIVHNWDSTELGKKYDLILRDGELVSQQYKTDIGPIDILAKDKETKSYVVIELKRNQTSDDTIGQLARYMGWIKEHEKDSGVKGVIIAGQYDKKLDYALRMVPSTEVFLYEVDFELRKFKKENFSNKATRTPIRRRRDLSRTRRDR